MSNASKPKSRLGRGLSSLISVSELPVETELSAEVPALPQTASQPQPSDPPAQTAPVTPVDLPVAEIVPNPHQPRREFNEATLASLAASIRSTGLIQPIVVRRAAAGGYELVAGERRLRAAKVAGLTHIPAIVRDVDSFKQAQMALIENVQREDLNPIDRAQAYRALMDQLGLTQAELAGRIGEDRSSVANFLRLLELSEPVRELLRNGQLSMGHAKILAGIADPVQQQELAQRVIAQELSVRNLERILTETPPAPAKQPAAEPSAHIRDLERSLTSQLGLRVQVRSTSSKGKGRLVIHYSSLDQFDQVLERLGVKAD
ncbi:MAG TPA: ParB/RepB/Spo0J family partition protein [Planctomycetaceae bacterium]|nr:ParB/RepB/Spo0J family partition protein [Planctomycetaceae bacterium]